MTLSLRPIAPADVSCLDAWLGDAARSLALDDLACAAAGARLLARVRAERALRARIIVRDGAPIGALAYRPHAPRRGAASFEFVLMPPAEARRGDGMRAAALAEREMLAAKVRMAYAPAPAVHGIAMYFWIRLGYRPLLQHEWPCRRRDVVWLRRDLS